MRLPNCIAWAAALTLAGCMAPSSGLPSPAPPAPPADANMNGQPYALSQSELQIAHEGVRRTLKHPMSAVFAAFRASINDRGVVSVCGLVNGRNSFGGYAGDKIFIGVFNDQRTAFYPSAIAVTENDAISISTLCRRIGASL